MNTAAFRFVEVSTVFTGVAEREGDAFIEKRLAQAKDQRRLQGRSSSIA